MSHNEFRLQFDCFLLEIALCCAKSPTLPPSTGSALLWSLTDFFSPQCLLDHDAIVRGDLAEIDIGMRCFIGKRTVLRPSSKAFKKYAALSSF